MFRRVIAGLFLGPALLIGSFAWTGFIATRTVFDADRSTTIAQELLDDENVRSQLSDNLATAVEAALPEDVSISGTEMEAAADRILGDPEVERLLVEAFSTTHRAFLGRGAVPRTLDLTPVASLVRAELVSAAPSLDEQLPAAAPLVVTLPTDQIPNAKPVDDFLRKAVPLLAAMSVVGISIAFLATTDRPAVLKRAALWALTTTAVYLIIGLGIPELMQRFAPDQAKVVAVLLSALLRSTLAPSIVLAVIGTALLITGFVWPQGDRSGADAAATPRRVMVPRSVAAATRHTESWPTMPTARADPATPPPTSAAATPTPSPASPASRPSLDSPPQAASLVPPAEARLSTASATELSLGFAFEPQIGADPERPESPTGERPTPVSEPSPTPESSIPEPPAPRSVLPTRANHTSPVDLPAWTGEPETPKLRPPRWVEGHGWVLDPDDPRPPPSNSRWVEGVGHVIPGPPPQS